MELKLHLSIAEHLSIAVFNCTLMELKHFKARRGIDRLLIF